ncbi:MAG: hypothetical protein LBD82_06405 [Deltaproteobacteria bacterium]|jgi:phage baseplate assembly protein W|nr:hypothetical protein [Deltaproteobacteria bacterium]
MRLTVDMSFASAGGGLTLAASGLAGLEQELRVLLGTPAGSVPLDRDFGIDWSMVDSPISQFMPLYVAEVSRKIERYIPRVRVMAVDLPQTDGAEALDGVIRPRVTLEIR